MPRRKVIDAQRLDGPLKMPARADLDKAIKAIERALSGSGCELQGAAIANAAAKWVAGHTVPGNIDGTWKARAYAFEWFFRLVHELTETTAREHHLDIDDKFAMRH